MWPYVPSVAVCGEYLNSASWAMLRPGKKIFNIFQGQQGVCKVAGPPWNHAVVVAMLLECWKLCEMKDKKWSTVPTLSELIDSDLLWQSLWLAFTGALSAVPVKYTASRVAVSCVPATRLPAGQLTATGMPAASYPATSSAASAQAVVIWQSDSFQGQYNQALAASVKGCVVCKAVRTAETSFRPHFPLLIKTWSEYLSLGEKFGPKLKLLLAAAEPVSEFKELMVPPAWQHPRTSQLLRGGSAGRLVVQGFRLFTLFYYQD